MTDTHTQRDSAKETYRQIYVATSSFPSVATFSPLLSSPLLLLCRQMRRERYSRCCSTHPSTIFRVCLSICLKVSLYLCLSSLSVEYYQVAKPVQKKTKEERSFRLCIDRRKVKSEEGKRVKIQSVKPAVKRRHAGESKGRKGQKFPLPCWLDLPPPLFRLIHPPFPSFFPSFLLKMIDLERELNPIKDDRA